jgi:hypothetical protein
MGTVKRVSLGAELLAVLSTLGQVIAQTLMHLPKIEAVDRHFGLILAWQAATPAL